jgi:hypothetical protein
MRGGRSCVFAFALYIHPHRPFLLQTGPTVPETIEVLGLEQTLLRLKGALVINSQTVKLLGD